MLHNPTIAEQHEHWMANYGRTYNDPQEKAMRQAIFAKTLQFIEDFNKSGNRTFKLGLNQFSDLTNEEFVRSHTGYLAPRQPEPAKTPSVNHQKLTGEVPDHIDWVEKGVVNAIKYQGHRGSCWAFSVVAAVEGIAVITNGTLLVLSVQQLVDCETTSYGCGGGYLDNSFKYIIQNQGIASDNSYAYEGVAGTCDATKAAKHTTQIKGFRDVPSREDELMKAVAQQPVSVIISSSHQEFLSYSGAVAKNDSDGVDCVLSVTEDSSFDGWIMDYGCSFHTTPNRNWIVQSRALIEMKTEYLVAHIIFERVMVSSMGGHSAYSMAMHKFKVKLQLETSEVAGTSGIINTDDACSEVELIEPTVAVANEFDKEVMSENPVAVEPIGAVGE
ncbi:senescence-specific cysteine protease SAG39-like [Eucalyptus grandis]|uniref:senescence-specific cysteine protease SAG39-like n=1 Tax=Eucalyptus grandis TaxID=71139 RepID=UPI00192E9B3E|nr:senescence-specific cysteine protease SAG39-like [Eucalyptus grandis]